MVNIIREKLLPLRDEKYRSFQSALMPTVDKETVLGVRTPHLRKLSKELIRSGEYPHFLHTLPHRYFEENNLHAFVISQIKDFDLCICEINRFLPYVDNWSTCDSIRAAVFRQNRPKLLSHIEGWISSPHSYTVRFGIEMLMLHFLDEYYQKEHLQTVADIHSEEYYVNMMRAWYFATALAKQREDAFPYFQSGKLDEWTRKKAIQKARESFTVDDEVKALLITLK